MKCVVAVLVCLMAALPARAQTSARDEASRLAVAVLGRVCLLGLGDPFATQQVVRPGGEFGFTEVPHDIAGSLLQGRRGVVRALRRPAGNTLMVVVGDDGICSVWSQLGEAEAVRRYISAMVEAGGMKGGGQLLPMGAKAVGGAMVSEWYLLPAGWYARDLGRRAGDDGSRPVLVTAALWPSGGRPFEALLSAAPGK
ncbi:MAG: hypothetical protein HYU60_01690 [Magnetospirillum sp.]|nr:hypothetical protein [Magnetospirillum sp.]